MVHTVLQLTLKNCIMNIFHVIKYSNIFNSCIVVHHIKQYLLNPSLSLDVSWLSGFCFYKLYRREACITLSTSLTMYIFTIVFLGSFMCII